MTAPDTGASHNRHERASRWYLLAGLLLAPLAWLAQMVIAETLAAQSCYPFDRPLAAPAVPWLRFVLAMVSAVCLVVGGIGAGCAWRNVRLGAVAAVGHSTGEGSRSRGLKGFLARVAAMSSALFLFALVATDVALALVSPCKGL